ncbi:hypothetical protein WME95_18995 [Sorangium sp. So ce327]
MPAHGRFSSRRFRSEGHAELKAMADEIVSAQNQEISQLKSWREQG